jgi:hypothetical protein
MSLALWRTRFARLAGRNKTCWLEFWSTLQPVLHVKVRHAPEVGLLQDISQIDPLPRHPVRNHRVRDQEPNPVRGWDGKPEVIALEAHTLKSDRSSKRASRKLARLVTVSRLLFTASKDRMAG